MWEYWPLLTCAAVVWLAGDWRADVRRDPGPGPGLALCVASVPTVLEQKYGMQSVRQMDDYAALGTPGTKRARADAAARDGRVDDPRRHGVFMPDVTTIDQWWAERSIRRPSPSGAVHRGRRDSMPGPPQIRAAGVSPQPAL